MGSGSNGSGYTRTAMQLEGQNDDRLEGLLGKVKMLKDVSTICLFRRRYKLMLQITVGIGNEVRDSNMELGGMVNALSKFTW